MIKYIIEILKIQSSVILPGFGSLQVANAKTGKIVFNAFLKFNDGTLAKYISEKEGIDQQAAQNQIAKFVREIEAEIAKGNSFDMFQFGKFLKNKKGEVEFIQEGTPVLPAADMKKPAAAAVKETKAEEKTDKKPAAKAAKKEEPKVEKAAEKKAEAKPAKNEAPKIEEKPVTAKPVETPKSDAKKEEVKPAPILEEKKPDSKAPVKEEKAVEVKAETRSLDAIKKDLEAKAAGIRKDEPKVEKPVEAIKKDEPKVEKPVEPVDSKQTKNSFTEEKAVSDPALKAAEEKAESKVPEISKNIPLAEASKKDPAAQEKNKFVPPIDTPKTETVPETAKSTPKVMAASVHDEKIVHENAGGTKEKFKKDKPQKVKNEVPKEKKKKSKWVRWVVILIILGGGAAAGWMYKDQIKGFLYAGVGDHSDTTAVHHDADSLAADHTTQGDDHGIAEEDTSSTEAPITEEPVVEEPVVEEPVVETHTTSNHSSASDHSSSGGSYHLIGNSFSSKENAENYAEKMSGKGYPAKVLGKFDNLYLVSLKSYSSRDEAKAGLSSVSSDAASAWVFKY